MASNYQGFPVTYRDTVGVQLSVSDNEILVPSATGVDTANDKILSTAHPFLDGDLVLYNSGTAAITGLTDGSYYYVRDKAANEFKLTVTAGGSAIDLTGTGTGTQTFTGAAQIKARARGSSTDVAESPLYTDVNGEIADGGFAAIAVGTVVNFRCENYRGMSFSVAQTTT